MSQRALVLGGSRFIGAGVARALQRKGYAVSIFNRGSRAPAEGISLIRGDRLSVADVESARARRFDVLVDTSGYDSRMVEVSATAFRGRVARYVFLSSGAVYAEDAPAPYKESAPLGARSTWGEYGLAKVRSEMLLQAECQRGSYDLTVLRPTYVFGPGDYTERIDFIFDRIEDGRPILLADGGHADQQFVSQDDLASVVAAVSSGPGGTFNVAPDEVRSLRQLVDACARVAGRSVRVLDFPSSRLLPETPYDWKSGPFPFANERFTFDTAHLHRRLGGLVWTPNERTLEEIHRARSRPSGRAAATSGEQRITQHLSDDEP